MTFDLSDERKRAANIINGILSGNIIPEAALKEWPTNENDASLKAAKHALVHFIDDDDIRKKDKRYEEHQISQLKRFALILEEGEQIESDEIEWFTPRKLSLLGFLKNALRKIKGA